MGVAIALFTWLGTYLDDRFQTGNNIWTVVLSLIGVFTGLYLALKDFIGNNKND